MRLHDLAFVLISWGLVTGVTFCSSSKVDDTRVLPEL